MSPLPPYPPAQPMQQPVNPFNYDVAYLCPRQAYLVLIDRYKNQKIPFTKFMQLEPPTDSGLASWISDTGDLALSYYLRDISIITTDGKNIAKVPNTKDYLYVRVDQVICNGERLLYPVRLCEVKNNPYLIKKALFTESEAEVLGIENYLEPAYDVLKGSVCHVI